MGLWGFTAVHQGHIKEGGDSKEQDANIAACVGSSLEGGSGRHWKDTESITPLHPSQSVANATQVRWLHGQASGVNVMKSEFWLHIGGT